MLTEYFPNSRLRLLYCRLGSLLFRLICLGPACITLLALGCRTLYLGNVRDRGGVAHGAGLLLTKSNGVWKVKLQSLGWHA